MYTYNIFKIFFLDIIFCGCVKYYYVLSFRVHSVTDSMTKILFIYLDELFSTDKLYASFFQPDVITSHRIDITFKRHLKIIRNLDVSQFLSK